jgi:hypothetical protein
MQTGLHNDTDAPGEKRDDIVEVLRMQRTRSIADVTKPERVVLLA